MFWLKLLLVLCANCARQNSRSVVCLRVAARGPCRTRHLVCTVGSSDPAEHKKVGCDCTVLQVQLDCFTVGVVVVVVVVVLLLLLLLLLAIAIVTTIIVILISIEILVETAPTRDGVDNLSLTCSGGNRPAEVG